MTTPRPVTTVPAASALPRIVRARSWEPPYDDVHGEVGEADLGPRGPLTSGSLALAAAPLPFEPGRWTARHAPAAPRLRLVPPSVVADDDGPRPTGRGELPAPGPWASRLVQAVVEVLAGDRPSAQLVRWTDERVYFALRASIRPAAPHETPRSTSTRPAAPTHRAQLRSLRLCEPDDGVAEVSATVRRGDRTTAIALRLEGLDGRWVCTALELVGRRP